MTSTSTLTLIVAAAENGVIGRDGDLPWRLPADLRRFRRVTTGHPIVMGRKTFESIGRLLPGRTSIVVTRNREYSIDEHLRAVESDPSTSGVVVHSLDVALEMAALAVGGDEVFVIGGEAIFRLALSRADRLHLTLVHAEIDGDVRFPLDELDGWALMSSERSEADQKNSYDHTFRIYTR